MRIQDDTDINKFIVEDEIKEYNEKEIRLNKSSAYDILDIKMYDLEVGKDTLAEHKTHHAEHEKHLAEIHFHERQAKANAEEAEAKVELLRAQALMHKGIAEGFKNGNFKYSDYQKDRLLFHNEDNRHKHTEKHQPHHKKDGGGH